MTKAETIALFTASKDWKKTSYPNVFLNKTFPDFAVFATVKNDTDVGVTVDDLTEAGDAPPIGATFKVKPGQDLLAAIKKWTILVTEEFN